MRHRLVCSAITLTATALVGTALVGCDDGQETAQYPPQPTQTAAPYPTQTAPVPAPTATTTAPANRATVLPPASGLLAAPILQGTAEKETSGMSADGQAVVASFMQGQIHEQEFMIQPGRCYTVIGVGMGVSELDIVIMLNQPPAPETPIAQDDRSGPHAVVGGAGQCHQTRSPVPVPVKIRTTATTGSGIVTVQVFSK